MTKKKAQSRSELLEAQALKLIARHYKVKNPILANRIEDRLAPTKESIYQFYAVAEDEGNGPRYAVVLTEAGEEIDLDEVEERDQKKYFPAADGSIDTSKIHPLLPAAAVTIQPTTNDLVLEQGDKHTETITVTVPANAQAQKVDVYFLADTTGSMGALLNAVETGAGNILTTLNGLGLDFAFGVGNYKDFPNSAYAFKHQLNPTNVAAAVQNEINHWVANGGNDLPEGQLYALDKLAQAPGGAIGWRPAAKRIIVWFGDAPGHDPVCAAISGEAADITEATVKAKLVAENITVLAISTGNPGLDGDPKVGSDYVPDCGPPGGSPGQGSKIANATGGKFVSGIHPANIVQTIIDLVKSAVGAINNLKLVPAGATASFVTSITPPGGYGPLVGDREHVLTFEVTFTGIAPCKDDVQILNGSLDVVADGAVVAAKKVRITVPACQQGFIYSVKFVCGVAQECDCKTSSLQPGTYATEINLHNYQNKAALIRKQFIPLILAGAVVGREPDVAGITAKEEIELPPHSATMDDCCRIGEMLLGASPTSPLPLMVGILEIASLVELSVTAVYTASSVQTGHVSIDVEQVKGRRVQQHHTSKRRKA